MNSRLVADLFVNCSYPNREDVLAASDTCQTWATSVVVMENGDLHYRCSQHQGQRRPNETGQVRWSVPIRKDPPSN